MHPPTFRNALKPTALVSLLAFALPLLCAESRDVFASFSFKIWGRDEGAPTVRINDLLEGSDGFLWLATYEGLIRYDGNRHRSYTYRDHPALVGGLLSIAEPLPGQFWMVTTNGRLVRLQDGRFTVWTATEGFPAALNERVAATPLGKIVLLGENGFLTIDEQDQIVPFPTPRLPSHKPLAFAFDSAGTLWSAPQSGGLFAWRNGEEPSFLPLTRVADSNLINAIFPQPDGTIWLGMDGGVALLNSADGSVRFFRSDQVRVQDRSLRMMRAHGPVLIGGNTLGGLFIFTPEGLLPFQWGSPSDPNEIINAITPLTGGGFALGTYSKGLILIQPSPFPFFNESNGLDGVLVNSIRADKGPITLIAHNRGIDRFDGRSFTRLELDGVPFGDYTVDVLRDSADRLWIGTFGNGLFLLDGRQLRQYNRSNGLSTNIIRAIQEDRKGNIWIGTRDGLYRWREGEVVQRLTTGDGLRSNYILSLYLDAEDRLWVGTARGGLHLVVDDRLQAIHTGDNDEFANRTVFAMSTDRKGRVWGGMSGGIFRIIGTDVEYFEIFLQFDIDSVYQIIDDGQQAYWLAASNGLHRIPHQLLDENPLPRENIRGQVRIFGVADGLPTEVMRATARMHRSEDGKLWFPTDNGFFILDPFNLPVNRTVPPIVLDGVIANGIPYFKQWFFKSASQAFAPGLRRIEFQFAAPYFRTQAGIAFRVRLLGFEDEWRITQKRSVEYTNLPPGRYLFEVAAINPDGFASDQPASFAFTIQPFFHETPWFLLLLAGVFIGSGIALYHRRTWLLRKRQQELVELVDERTREIRAGEQRLAASNAELQHLNREKNQFLGIAAHDLRNPLATIETLSELIADEAGQLPTQPIAEYCQDILDSARRMRALIDNLLDINRIECGQTIIHVSPFPAHQVVEAVLRQHRRAAAQKNISLREELILPASITIQADPAILGQILDNFVSNAIKFSPRDRSVTIRVEPAGNFARFSVSDEGPGIPIAEKDQLFRKFSKLSNQPTGGEPSTGLGLSIAKQLTELMGGRIGCDSIQGKGATFWVELPRLNPTE